MIRHPNNSGLQRDPVSLLYIPLPISSMICVSGFRGDQLSLAVLHGGWHIHFRRPQHPFFLSCPTEKRFPRRGDRHREGHVFRREWPVQPGARLSCSFHGAPRRRIEKSRLKAAHFRFRLRTAQILDRRRACSVERNWAPQLFPATCDMLQHCFGCDVAFVRQERGDDVDRTRALFERMLRLAVGFHAAKHIIDPRGGWIIVEILRGALGFARMQVTAAPKAMAPDAAIRKRAI